MSKSVTEPVTSRSHPLFNGATRCISPYCTGQLEGSLSQTCLQSRAQQ